MSQRVAQRLLRDVEAQRRRLPDVQQGSIVIVRDALGKEHVRRAYTPVIAGRDFAVVRVGEPKHVKACIDHGTEPDVTPWPATDVRLPKPGESL